MTLPLPAGQQIAVMSMQAVTLTWAMFGGEVNAGVPQYKCLAANSVAVGAQAWTTIYQVPTGRMALVTHIVIQASAVCQLNVGSGGGGYLLQQTWVQPGGWASWDENGWHFTDLNSRRWSA